MKSNVSAFEKMELILREELGENVKRGYDEYNRVSLYVEKNNYKIVVIPLKDGDKEIVRVRAYLKVKSNLSFKEGTFNENNLSRK